MPLVQRRLCEAKPAARGHAASEQRSQWGPWTHTPVPTGCPCPSWAAGALPVSPLQLLRGRKPANPRPSVILCQLMGLTSELKAERAGSPLHALSVQISDLLGKPSASPSVP